MQPFSHLLAECGGDEVYHAYTDGDGSFNPDEREKHLGLAIHAIDMCLRDGLLREVATL